jgi:hypothetical protein
MYIICSFEASLMSSEVQHGQILLVILYRRVGDMPDHSYLPHSGKNRSQKFGYIKLSDKKFMISICA